MKRKLLFGLVMPLIFVAAMSIAIWLNASSSEPRIEAERFLRNNPVVEEQIGTVQVVSMYPFSSWHISEYGKHGNARLNLSVKGSKQDARARLELERNGHWHVTSGALTIGATVTPLVATHAK